MPKPHETLRGTPELPELLRGLCAPAAYPHAVRKVRVVQTHISWVLLTGAYAYKIKKPVVFPFLDFSTPARRLAACREELRLNRRLAPELYIDVVTVAGTAQRPRVGGAGPAIEYAVRMREFPQAAQLDRRLAGGRLEGAELEAFARRLAAFHAAAPRAGARDAFGAPARVHAPLRDTLDDLDRRARGASERAALGALRAWCEREFARIRPALAARKRAGAVREGHGDLHLANLVHWGGAVVAFDCIEFNPALRWVDAVADVAFLAMDLAYRGRPDLAWRFLNAWLEESGDYGSLAVLRYYLADRALVRAKIAAIRRDAQPAGRRAADARSIRRHLALARSFARAARPRLVLMHGLSGSGKTWVGGELMAGLPAVRIRSDVERKRLHGLAAGARSGSPPGGGLYAADATARTYRRLLQLARAALAAGHSVVVDAAFLRRAQRAPFLRLAARLGVPCAIVECRAPAAVLERRVRARLARGADASEADLRVLAGQRARVEPPDRAEGASRVAVDTARPFDRAAPIGRLRRVGARA